MPGIKPFHRRFRPTGRVIIVYWWKRGVGHATIQHPARHGAKIYMGARNEDKAQAVTVRLHLEGLEPGNGEIA
ncbi:hypothetical protein A0H81_02443 [Grifola frondosa]|uniref:Uncharacterized protein n=1 Tax=Grifola frondosa TaxID=5627 RepID=A0A1C7MPE7_GRIFR|nr:hypothetical protein A0H81_02443 [Grifola frondosa]